MKSPACEDELESDSSSEDGLLEKRAAEYTQSVDEATRPALKAARAKGMLRNKAAIHSEALDIPAPSASVKAMDFEMGKDPNETVKYIQPAEAAASADASAMVEEMPNVAKRTLNALGVRAGDAHRRIAELVVEKFEAIHQRRAVFSDCNELNRMIAAEKEIAAQEAKEHKWSNSGDDAQLLAIAGVDMVEAAAEVRNRIEAQSAEEYRRRESSRQVSTAEDALGVQATEVRYAGGRVSEIEVRVGGIGSTTSSHSTTPAPGTPQAIRIEENLTKLAERGVVVSQATASHKRATSVPPVIPVQGVHLGAGNAMGAVIHGDGSTMHTPTEYAMRKLNEKSETGEDLKHTTLEEMYAMMQNSVDTFYRMREVAPEDSPFVTEHVPYVEEYRHTMHKMIDKFFPGSDKTPTVEEKRRKTRDFFAATFAGYPTNERAEKLRQQLQKDHDPDGIAAGTVHRDAIANALLMGSRGSKTASKEDVHTAAKKKAVEWQVDAEVDAIRRCVGDVEEDELAEQLAHGLCIDRNMLMQSIRSNPANDALFQADGTGNEAPATLIRAVPTIYNHRGESGNEMSVLPEAERLAKDIQGSCDFLQVPRQAMSRKLREEQARCDLLLEESNKRQLEPSEREELKRLQNTLSAAKVAARNEEHRDYVRQLGHQDAGATVEALYKITEMNLEVVSREYVSSCGFMREPREKKYGERPCANDVKCVCTELGSSYRHAYDSSRNRGGFVCREFLLPSQLELYRTKGTLPKLRQFCYLCHIYQTTFRFLTRKEAQTGGERLHIEQKFQTIFDKPGEYSVAYCNLATILNHRAYGIVAPFPKFNAANYQYALCAEVGDNGEMQRLRCVVETTDVNFP